METGDARPEPEAPIIIVGTGRCGSTLLHRLLARHESLGWLSTFNEVFPKQPWLSMFSAFYEAPLPDRLRHAKAFPKPFEAYQFWEHYLPGFSRRDRPLTATDVPDSGIEPVRRATARVLRFQRRDRLLVKVTGWSRIAYFDRIYPGARFVSLRRDPRAVVSSWEQADWLDVSSPPDSPDWQWGEVPSDHLATWRALGGGRLVSAALKIRLDLDDIARNAELVPGRFHELTYEELVGNAEATLRSLCEFCGLEWSPRFEKIVREAAFYDSTDTWRKHLSEEEGASVLEFMERTEAAGGQVAESTARGRVRSKR
jgi:Sulfotransferase family